MHYNVKWYKPVLLLIFPSEQGMQSKQHTGFPRFLAICVPGGQLLLQTDVGGLKGKLIVFKKLFNTSYTYIVYFITAFILKQML